MNLFLIEANIVLQTSEHHGAHRGDPDGGNDDDASPRLFQRNVQANDLHSFWGNVRTYRFEKRTGMMLRERRTFTEPHIYCVVGVDMQVDEKYFKPLFGGSVRHKVSGRYWKRVRNALADTMVAWGLNGLLVCVQLQASRTSSEKHRSVDAH
jgi:hypothetical protein